MTTETIIEEYKNFIIRESNYYDDYGAWFGFYPFVYYHKNMHDDPELLSFTYNWAKTIEKCKEQIDYMQDDEIIMKVNSKKECPECCGLGEVLYSCCGDNITFNDYDNCPTCYEHCGDEKELCEFCDGVGYYYESEIEKK